jgi:hypothetical protein
MPTAYLTLAKDSFVFLTIREPTTRYTNFGVGHPFSRLNQSEFAYQGFGVSQEIPFPGKLGLASEEAKREAESEQQNYRFRSTSLLKVGFDSAASAAISATKPTATSLVNIVPPDFGNSTNGVSFAAAIQQIANRPGADRTLRRS